MEETIKKELVYLSPGYSDWWLDITSNLGAVYPFQDQRLRDTLTLDVGEIIASRRSRGISVELDPIGLAAKSINAYLLGNRTLLKEVVRSPWVAKPGGDGAWIKENLPSHGTYNPEPENFIAQLKKALIKEVQSYVRDANTVGILLSGGMDSRVVAGLVRDVQISSGNQFQVVGLTWGKETSRDVVYARQITERFGWEWHHYPLTAETVANNIRHMGEMGAEVSPLHLHAMPEVAVTPGIDVVLAGSYGDSVGRAEFSGKHLTELTPLLSKQKDRFGILRRQLFSSVVEAVKSDLADTPHLSDNVPDLRRREIEQEFHYMRRMLQCCMNTIARDKRFYQLFTSPDVFGLMWSLDPKVRDDRWYTYLLQQLPGNLLEIPWARTGRRYDLPVGPADSLSQKYHEYGLWLRNDLKSGVVERVNSSRIRELGLFNDKGLDCALNAWSRSTTISINSLDELFSWIASLHDFLEFYQIDVDKPLADLNWLDTINAIKGGAFGRVFVEVRNRMRM